MAWASLSALNLSLAGLLMSSQPRRPLNWILAGWMTLNAVASPILDLADGLLWELALPWARVTALFFLPVAVYFVDPHPSSKKRRWVWVAALLPWPFMMWPEVTFELGGLWHWAAFVSNVGWTPLLLAGTVALALDYGRSRSLLRRRQAGFFLAAFLLAAEFRIATLARRVSGAEPTPELATAPVLAWSEALMLVFQSATVLVILALLVLVALRSRPEDPGQGYVPALVVAMVPVGFALSVPQGMIDDLPYMLVRPLLFAYAVLQVQFLDVDPRQATGLVTTMLLAAFAALFFSVAVALEGFSGSPALELGLPLITALAATGLVAAPLARRLLAPHGRAADARAHDVYRAALEQAVSGGSTASSQVQVLRALRGHLGISEREHAVLEIEVRRGLGAHQRRLSEGTVFLDRYRIVRHLGRGGFGETFLASDERLDRDVALKIARVASEEHARRALREARIVAQLDHPNIVTIHDVEEVADDIILVLEYLPAGSLAGRIADGPMSLDEAIGIVDDVLSGLEAAHDRGVVHSDVKPANILLTADGRAKLADFGIATPPTDGATATGMSYDGTGAGTLRYMSPEQVRGLDVDPRSDLYAVGVLLYELLTGRHCIDLKGRPDFESRLAILEDPPDLPIEGVPDRVNAALDEALSKDRSGRPADAAAMRRLLAGGGGASHELR